MSDRRIHSLWTHRGRIIGRAMGITPATYAAAPFAPFTPLHGAARVDAYRRAASFERMVWPHK